MQARGESDGARRQGDGDRTRPAPLAGRRRIRSLREGVRRSAQNRPGVYRMLGPRGETLYVGKSVRLRERLLSYFTRGGDGKAAELLRSTRRIAWDEVPDEFGALLLERRLIRKHRPRFNVQHKARTRPLFLELTNETAPRLLLTRAPRPGGRLALGPLPSGPHTARAVRDLAHATGLRDCAARTPIRYADQLDLLGLERAPLCLRGSVGSCPAPCAGGCTAEGYRQRVQEVREFLRGREDAPLRTVGAQLEEAVDAREYELAAHLRDRLERLERLRDEVVAFQEEVGALTFLYRPAAIAPPGRLYLVRRGRVTATLDAPQGERTPEDVRKRIEAAMGEPDPEPAELGPDGAGEVLLVAAWFRRRPEEHARTVAPEAWLASSG